MGVPKFYRWISERYPKINEIVSDNALLPEFDHLYLDMNGIIHGCTHPSHLDVADVLSERDMMFGIMHYLDRIITQIVKPKVSVYMAIDGVAPRAKLNQQRSRRFRSAKDLAEATKDLPKDEQGNKAKVFDSNCITPGTEFLAKVSRVIQYFIRKKMKEDPLWHGLTVIFSGHDVPGEGEHKIMQHIREMRCQPGYQPNTRHCIYGQDADLIMLGLVTHEPHFTILREVVEFDFNFRSQNTLKAVKKFTKESDFQLLHLSILREYLQIEFCAKCDEVNLERIIDDFVFMTFLVGNDFLPHMPTLDIGDGAFDLLFGIYKAQRPSWGEGKYLTQSGQIMDPHRLEIFLAAIGAVETEILEQREKDDAVNIKKRRRWDRRDGKPEGPSDAELKAAEEEKQLVYSAMIESMLAQTTISGEMFVDGWKPTEDPSVKDFKGRYYFEKLGLTPIDKNGHWALRQSYMEGLMWCLAYYYKGCISWGWFYPFHYGPMLSDLIDLPRMFSQIKFELGTPLTPFQQLMGCLPPASSDLVPKPYRWLMTSPKSPIISFYPQDFEVDMNGKKNPWEGVNLLPFIDIRLLIDTIEQACPPETLSSQERFRNTVGTVTCYKHDLTAVDTVVSPLPEIGIPDLLVSHTSISIVEEQEGGAISFEPKLIQGTKIPYPGFPSLNVIPIASVEHSKIGLNCFGSPSKYLTLVLSLYELPELAPIEILANNLLGKSVFVNWPMMHEGRIVGISNEKKEIRLGAKNSRKEVTFIASASERWKTESEAMFQMYLTGNGIPGSGGVNIGPIKLRLKVLPLQGMRTNQANGSTKKYFGSREADVPLQLCLLEAPAPDPRFIERGPMVLSERYPPNAMVVLTKGKYRGCIGTVVSVVDDKHVAVNVKCLPADFPFGLAIARSVQESYISSTDASRILKMHPGLLGKVAGRLQFEQGKYDLGLNIKTADGMCVVGYTRKKVDVGNSQKGKDRKPAAWSAGDTLLIIGSHALIEDEKKEERIQWEYTPKAIRLIDEYRKKFPQLFMGISKNPNEKKYCATSIFGPKGEAWLPVIREWLNNHETAKLPRSPITTESMSYEAVAEIERAADVRTLALKKKGYPKESLIKIPGTALYREGTIGATDVLLASDLNNGESPQLGDRIVNLCVDGIPFGARGTVIGIHEASTTGCVEVVMDEVFIGGTSLQGACSNFRGKLCVWSHLLKTSPDNSENIIAKHVPKGSGKSAVSMILSGVSKHVDSHKPDKINNYIASDPSSSNVSQVREEVNKSETHSTVPLKTKAQRCNPNKSFGTGNDNTVRVKPSTWRDAKGPDGNGNGFKGVRGTKKSGFKRWKAFVEKSRTPAHTPNVITSDGMTETATLKAILGVVPNQGSQSYSAQSDELKAILGVNASAKAIAVGSYAPLCESGSSDAAPLSAAELLLRRMATNKPTDAVDIYPRNAIAASGFNFTYKEVGKDQYSTDPDVSRPLNSMLPVSTQHIRPETQSSRDPPLPQSAIYPVADISPIHQGVTDARTQTVGLGFIVPSVVTAKAKR